MSLQRILIRVIVGGDARNGLVLSQLDESLMIWLGMSHRDVSNEQPAPLGNERRVHVVLATRGLSWVP